MSSYEFFFYCILFSVDRLKAHCALRLKIVLRDSGHLEALIMLHISPSLALMKRTPREKKKKKTRKCPRFGKIFADDDCW